MIVFLLLIDALLMALALMGLRLAYAVARDSGPEGPRPEQSRIRFVGTLLAFAGFALLGGWLGYAGFSAPEAVWTRNGHPSAHGFAVGALGTSLALLFVGTAVQTARRR